MLLVLCGLPRLPVVESSCDVLTENHYWTDDGDKMRLVFSQVGETDMDGHWHWWKIGVSRKLDIRGKQLVFTDETGVLRRVRFRTHICIASDYDLEVDDRSRFPMEHRKGLPPSSPASFSPSLP